MADKTYCLPDGTVLTMPATAAQRLAELEAENERLRALLPSAETRQALRRAMVDAGWSHNDNVFVWKWLERLEAPDNRPRPDWSQAPDWATWWAVDADGEAHWYDGNPLVFMTLRWGFYEGNKYNRSYAGYVVLPLGLDWRTLKEQRP